MLSILAVEERLRQTEGRSRASWIIALEATSPEDIAFLQDLHERYLEPFLTPQGQYKSHLEILARSVSVRPIKRVPILLFAGELPEEKDNQFIRWVYYKRHLSSMTALRASDDAMLVWNETSVRIRQSQGQRPLA